MKHSLLLHRLHAHLPHNRKYKRGFLKYYSFYSHLIMFTFRFFISFQGVSKQYLTPYSEHFLVNQSITSPTFLSPPYSKRITNSVTEKLTFTFLKYRPKSYEAIYHVHTDNKLLVDKSIEFTSFGLGIVKIVRFKITCYLQSVPIVPDFILH